MEKNIQVFFALVRAGLWEKDVLFSAFEQKDFSEVYRLAQEQSVTGLVAAGLEHVENGKVPKVIALQFVGRTLQLEQQNKGMNQFIGEIVDKMMAKGIYTLLVKGQGIAQCYERPLWRECGDVDFFLSDENYEKAKAFLVPLATSVESEGAFTKHIGMFIDSWEVELHGSLRLGLPSNINRVLDEIKDDVFCNGNIRLWQNGEVKVFLPNADNDAVYVFAHYFNHFYKGGIGLRQICDWCRLLWTFRDKIDEKLLKSRLDKMGLVSEWKAFGAFAVEYLGMPIEAMPLYSSDKKWKRKAEQICGFIMEVGNMGHNRDFSYYSKYPFLIRKVFSFSRRVGDLYRHASIFPLNSLRFFPTIVYNGLRFAAKGE